MPRTPPTPAEAQAALARLEERLRAWHDARRQPNTCTVIPFPARHVQPPCDLEAAP